MGVTSTKRFKPFSLDAVNFLLSDVRGAISARSSDASLALP
jgi:hypothetical protein